jgi:hypothetical protein
VAVPLLRRNVYRSSVVAARVTGGWKLESSLGRRSRKFKTGWMDARDEYFLVLLMFAIGGDTEQLKKAYMRRSLRFAKTNSRKAAFGHD